MPKGEEIGWKILGGVAALGAGMLARKAIEATWKAATGKEPPGTPEDPDEELLEAMGWAIASGAAVGIARMLATRVAAARWRRITGELPPGVRQST